MTDTEWWQKAESLRERYPDINVASAFPAVIDAYLESKPNTTQDLPFEFVVDALILFRHAAGLAPVTVQEIVEPVAPASKEIPKVTHAVVEVTKAEDLSQRKGCAFFKR